MINLVNDTFDLRGAGMESFQQGFKSLMTDYVEEDEEYKKKWTRFTYINTDLWDDYYTLEDRYIALEQEENKKKYKKPKQIVKKRKN